MPVFAAFLYNAMKLHILVFDSVKGKLKGKTLVVFNVSAAKIHLPFDIVLQATYRCKGLVAI